MLIVKEDRGRENGIKHVWDDFTKSFEIVFTVFSGLLLCGTSKSSYKVSFHFRKKTKHLQLNEIERKVKLEIKDNYRLRWLSENNMNWISYVVWLKLLRKIDCFLFGLGSCLKLEKYLGVKAVAERIIKCKQCLTIKICIRKHTSGNLYGFVHYFITSPVIIFFKLEQFS